MLMARVAARDGDAFRLLVEAHTRSLHRIAFRMLGDPGGAEDIAQEALLRLWDHAARWRSDGPGVGAWLHRVATNLCLDRLRRRKFQSDDEVPERIDDAPLADDRMDEDRMKTATLASIGALPDRQRAAIVLTYYEDLSNGDAAAALDMNIKAFESLLLRARRALRRSLEASGLLPDFAKRDTP
jgi:RNA polymerase sigma-70 factor (ECF subfamily)